MVLKDDKTGDRLRIGFWSSGIIILWMGAAYFLSKTLSQEQPTPSAAPSMSDMATIFFGASSLALIIFSLLLAVAAMIQWQSFKNEVQSATGAAVEEKMQGRVNSLEQELRGRIDAVMGAIIGTLHSDPTTQTQRDDAKAYIGEALLHAQRGYDRLKELNGNGKYMALNSVAYFSCLLASPSKRDLLLAQGRELRDIGRKYQHLPYSAPYLMTFCRVQLVYGSEPEEINQALGIAQELLEQHLTNLQRKEVTYLVTSLTAKLAGFSSPAKKANP